MDFTGESQRGFPHGIKERWVKTFFVMMVKFINTHNSWALHNITTMFLSHLLIPSGEG